MPQSNHQSEFSSGIWKGFFIEARPEKGWMHLYLQFEDGKIKGEGTDRVGPWHILGNYDDQSGQCSWIKQYLGKHEVIYEGVNQGEGIVGTWTIGQWSQGPFHIWPQGLSRLEEKYLQEDTPAPNAF